MARPSIEFGPLFYTQVIVGLTPTLATAVHDTVENLKNGSQTVSAVRIRQRTQQMVQVAQLVRARKQMSSIMEDVQQVFFLCHGETEVVGSSPALHPDDRD